MTSSGTGTTDMLLSILEQTDKVNPLQRRAPSWGVYQRQYIYWSEQVISQQQQDRDSEESDACMDSQAR